MAPRGQKVPILQPAWLKRGYYFRFCRGYRTPSGVFYDYRLYNPFGRELKLQQRGWRKTLSYNFGVPGGGGKQRRLEIHRLFAFNERVRCNSHGHRWGPHCHVHHHPRPKRFPWKGCGRKNMIVLTAAAHSEWHRRHPDVPNCIH